MVLRDSGGWLNGMTFLRSNYYKACRAYVASKVPGAHHRPDADYGGLAVAHEVFGATKDGWPSRGHTRK